MRKMLYNNYVNTDNFAGYFTVFVSVQSLRFSWILVDVVLKYRQQEAAVRGALLFTRRKRK